MIERTMRERVARAIASVAPQPGQSAEDWMLARADAAIAAMREPTAYMVKTSDDADWTNFGEGMGAEEHWRTMIDAALAEMAK